MLSELKRIFNDLWLAATKWRIWLYLGMQDVKNQFKRSRMGVLWIFINLLLMCAGIGFVYGHLFHQMMAKFIPLLTAGLVIWMFITSTFVGACQTFVSAEGYIKQFPLPKQIYVFRSFVAYAFTFLISLLVFILVAYVYHIPVALGTLWFIPGLLLLFAISLPVIITMAYWGAKFRDLGPALGGIFQIIFYITPIIFTVDMLKTRGVGFVYLYNPFYYLIETVRYPLLNAQAAPLYIYVVAFLGMLAAWGIAAAVMLACDRKLVNSL